MSFLATLKFGESVYTVLRADYDISKQIGHRNMVTSRYKIGTIKVEIEANGKQEFLTCIINNTSVNAELVFYKKDTKAALKSLKFSDATCIEYRELFEAEGKVPMRLFLVFTARQIESLGVVGSEEWPGFDSKSKESEKPIGRPSGQDSGHEEVVSFNALDDV